MAMNLPSSACSAVLVSTFLWLASPGVAQAQTGDQAVDDALALNACLAAWGNHPFGSHLTYSTLSTSVRMSGTGPATVDSVATNHPSLILVKPLVNAWGDAHMALVNPNGWYCLRAPADQLGALRVQLHCRARMAAASGGATTWGTGGAGSGPTAMGAVQVERVGCH
jgi:hypothetical protein